MASAAKKRTTADGAASRSRSGRLTECPATTLMPPRRSSHPDPARKPPITGKRDEANKSPQAENAAKIGGHFDGYDGERNRGDDSCSPAFAGRVHLGNDCGDRSRKCCNRDALSDRNDACGRTCRGGHCGHDSVENSPIPIAVGTSDCASPHRSNRPNPADCTIARKPHIRPTIVPCTRDAADVRSSLSPVMSEVISRSCPECYDFDVTMFATSILITGLAILYSPIAEQERGPRVCLTFERSRELLVVEL